MDNVKLVAGIQCGEEAAQIDLYREYWPKIVKWCRDVLRSDRAAAEDCAAEVFELVLTDGLRGLQEPRSLPGWLRTVARRTAIRRIESSREVAVPDCEPSSDQPGPDEVADRLGPWGSKLLARALPMVAPKQRKMYPDLLRIEVGDAKRADVAAEHGITELHLNVLLFRLRRQLENAIRFLLLPGEQWENCPGWRGGGKRSKAEHIVTCPRCKEESDRTLVSAGLRASIPFLFIPAPSVMDITRVSFRRALPRRALIATSLLAALALIGFHQWQPQPTTLGAPQAQPGATNTTPATTPSATVEPSSATAAIESSTARTAAGQPSSSHSSAGQVRDNGPSPLMPSSSLVPSASVTKPVDKAGPVISAIARTSGELSQRNGDDLCGNKQAFVDVSATVTDESTVTRIILTGVVRGQSRTWPMTSGARATARISYDMSQYKGSTSALDLTITAKDSAGNTSTVSAGQILLYGCTPG